MYDVLIAGAGASGMAAAISAARENPDLRVCIIERKDTPGKKLAATGNGHCNATNVKCEHYKETIEFFKSLGVLLKSDSDGRFYPYSGRADAVIHALYRELRTLGVKVVFNHCVVDVLPEREGFGIVVTDKQEDTLLHAKKVLVAIGGKAGPQYGTTGDGSKIAEKLGHRIVKVTPALTALECEGPFEELKGVRAAARAKLLKDGKEISGGEGEVQFNNYGLSGICILDLSRDVIIESGKGDMKEQFRHYAVSLDLVKDYSEEELTEIIHSNIRIPAATAGDILNSIVTDQLADYVLASCNVHAGGYVADIPGLDEKKEKELAHFLKNMTFTITGAQGWKYAQCTRGGVDLRDIDKKTMQSKKVPGVYFSGEVTDYDGPCGGFNLQYAWETGIKAGKAIAKSLEK
ncbi:MAG: aminoacetone oxidase family FAD-binding enzyme [Clostridia bacterium]|nr:aminoacetone oxidase family FAD-binding enzyme [Clostridia bacterium]